MSKGLVHQKSCYACQWLDNVDMHMYAKFEQNILCGSRAMSIFTNYLQTDGHTHTMIIVDRAVYEEEKWITICITI